MATASLTVRIERTGEETYLSQVVKLVRQAQESKSSTQDLANRAAALLFYVAVAVGAVTFAVWALLGNVQFALTRSSNRACDSLPPRPWLSNTACRCTFHLQ